MVYQELLSRIVAEEKIIVEFGNYEPNFNSQTRVLKLPILSGHRVKADQYAMFIAHECGHALFSPQEIFHSNKLLKIIENVVEDYRIDERMKLKFRGLDIRYRNAYRRMEYVGVIDVSGNLDDERKELFFLNRLNLYLKTKDYLDVSGIDHFTETERNFILEIYEVKTYRDVQKVSKKIYEYLNLVDKVPDSDRLESEKDGEFSVNYDEIGELLSTRSISDFFSSMNLDCDETLNLVLDDDYSTNNIIGREEYEKYRKQEYINYGIDYIESDQTKEIRESIVDSYIQGEKIKVSYLAQEFEKKKKAKEFAKKYENRTGIINSKKLYSYRFNDDIFLNDVVVNEGKNHGIFLLVDLSSSMSNVIESVFDQIALMALFSDRVKIPFVAYGFAIGFCGECDNFFELLPENPSRQDVKNFYNFYKKRKHMDLMVLLGNKTNVVSSSFMSISLAHKFRRKYNIEILSLMHITDGEGNTYNFNDGSQTHDLKKYRNICVRDSITNYVETYNDNINYTGLNRFSMNFLKKCVGCNFIGFYLQHKGVSDVGYTEESHECYDVFYKVDKNFLNNHKHKSIDFLGDFNKQKLFLSSLIDFISR